MNDEEHLRGDVSSGGVGGARRAFGAGQGVVEVVGWSGMDTWHVGFWRGGGAADALCALLSLPVGCLLRRGDAFTVDCRSRPASMAIDKNTVESLIYSDAGRGVMPGCGRCKPASCNSRKRCCYVVMPDRCGVPRCCFGSRDLPWCFPNLALGSVACSTHLAYLRCVVGTSQSILHSHATLA